LYALGQIHQSVPPDQGQDQQDTIHIVDTFPVPVCHNIRIKRCKIYRDKAFHGYCASKRAYFYGLKVSLIVTQAGEPGEPGEPGELLLAPGATTDIAALRSMDLNLPDGSILIGDA
jgi:hypothetical protein